MDFLVQINARAGDAALTAGAEDARHRTVHRAFQIRVVEHQHRRLAAQFQRHLGEVLGRIAHDMARRLRTAGKADARDQGMGGQHPPARLAKAGYDVNHAFRKARFLDQLGEFQHRRRRVFRGLQHHRVAGRERRADLDRDQEKLTVPRHHGGDDAERFACREDAEVGFVDRQRLAMHLVGEAGVEVEELGDVLRLPARFLQHLAGVDRLSAAQIFRLVGQKIAQPAQILAAFRRRHRRPRPFAERPVRGLDGAIDIAFGRRRDLGPHGTCRRVDAIERRAVPGVTPRAVDEHLIGIRLAHNATSPTRFAFETSAPLRVVARCMTRTTSSTKEQTS